MNRRRPTTTGVDQLSLNLSVTRSPDDSDLASTLFWPPGALEGGVAADIFFCLAGCLEVARGMAQCRGPTLAALGGLCDGGSLLTVVRGTSVGGAAGLAVAARADGAMSVGSGAVPGTTELVLGAPLLPGPPSAVPGEARLLGGCVGVYLMGASLNIRSNLKGQRKTKKIWIRHILGTQPGSPQSPFEHFSRDTVPLREDYWI